jgi:MFS superfamily sulfate permease-like transporter/CRP-like cAMP-binding protein
VTGVGLEGARESGWVGEEAPAVPVGDLFQLVDFSLVRWNLVTEIFSTWVGMVFVVSFASCLDVAAISMDMGEALDTNRELATVGICNGTCVKIKMLSCLAFCLFASQHVFISIYLVMSGLTFGFTGSYIFSQTIFTYRTGVHSRWIGAMIMVVFLYIVASPVNILEIAPLFFLGSTLIFIGYDLLYEWLWEIRHQVFLQEYMLIWLTFFAIQVVGIDAGIILGVLIAIVKQVLTAQTSNINRIQKKSRAVWTIAHTKLLHEHAYASTNPKIVTIEIIGTVFFGSAFNLLTRITREIGLEDTEESSEERQNETTTASSIKSPHMKSHLGSMDERRASANKPVSTRLPRSRPPSYLVLDLTSVSNLDASATRGCFLQLVRLLAKRNIIVCASGATPRIEWMLRSHKVSISTVEEEDAFKAHQLSRQIPKKKAPVACENILLFVTLPEALEFCETDLIHSLDNRQPSSAVRRLSSLSHMVAHESEEHSLASVLAHILGASKEETEILNRLEDQRYHEEIDVNAGEMIFQKETHSDSFFVVLKGCVANSTHTAYKAQRQQQEVLSGAGIVKPKRQGRSSHAQGAATLWPVGGVFGYLDFLLERPTSYRTIATLDGTRVARFTHSHINLSQAEDPELHALLQRVLLHTSSLDLANCTCSDV